MSAIEREIMHMLFKWAWEHARTKGERIALSLAKPALEKYTIRTYRN
jgi:hypothetical protein